LKRLIHPILRAVGNTRLSIRDDGLPEERLSTKADAIARNRLARNRLYFNTILV
jgi:hypothetical protein